MVGNIAKAKVRMTHCWLRYNSESWSPAHDGTTADEEDSTLATAAMIRSHLAEGALRVGRQPGEVTVTSLLPTAVGETRQQALDALRPGLAFYAGFFPRYNRLIADHGFTAEAAAIAEAWARGDRSAAERAVSDAMIDATSIAGTPQHCRERLEAYRRSGIDVPILSPFARGPGAKAKFEAAIRACAPSHDKSC